MKISLITTTFNSARTVADTLESVGRQNYLDIEHIIIDGRSTDETLLIINRYPYIAKILSEKDNGIYDAMNKGIDLASGEVVGIINSDDFYADNQVISRVMKEFEDPKVDIVYGDLQYVDQHNTHKIIRTWRSGNFDRSKFYYGWMPPHPTVFVRRKIYDEFGGFNTALKTSADYEFILRVMLKNVHQVRYVPQILVKMRTGGASNATLSHRLRANREDREAWRLNGIKPWFFTIPLKPIRKIFQFLSR